MKKRCTNSACRRVFRVANRKTMSGTCPYCGKVYGSERFHLMLRFLRNERSGGGILHALRAEMQSERSRSEIHDLLMIYARSARSNQYQELSWRLSSAEAEAIVARIRRICELDYKIIPIR